MAKLSENAILFLLLHFAGRYKTTVPSNYCNPKKQQMKTKIERWIGNAEKAFDRKHYHRSARWYRKAAEQGNAEAQYCLGLCYYGALGVELDDTEAVKWFRLAAEQGIPDAQKALGDMYLCGYGVKADDGEALDWYRKAFANGNAEAGLLIDQIIHAHELMI